MESFASGRQVGRYRILKRLGAGAMGEVYLAEDPHLGRRVAIKTVRLGADSGHLADRKLRLQREARAAGRLLHPRVVTLFDAGEEAGSFFLAFEHVEGTDLAARMESGEPFTVGTVVKLARQVAEGLGYAHAAGIVHRDIKPSNLLVDTAGNVKIADFGVAKISDQTSDLTATGSMVGSPQYLSPEQVRGEELDGRSDLFSLGVVLYQLLGGRCPFDAETLTSLVYQILYQEPPPLASLPGEVPPRLAALVERLLAKDRDQRFATAAELEAELAALEAELGREALDATAGVGPEDDEPTLRLASGPVAPGSVPGTAPGPAPGPAPGTVPGVPATTAAGTAGPAAIAPATGATSGRPRRALVIAALATVGVLALLVAASAVLTLRWWQQRQPETVAETAAAAPMEAAGLPESPGGERSPEDGAYASAGEDEGGPASDPEATPSTGRGEGGGDDAPPLPAPGGAPERRITPPVAAEPSATAPPSGGSSAGTPVAGTPLAESSAASPAPGTPPSVVPGAAEPEAPVRARLADRRLTTALALRLEIEPPDAFLLLDGTVIGRADRLAVPYELPGPGAYLLVARKAGRRDARLLLDASRRPGVTAVEVVLEHRPAEELTLADLPRYRVATSLSLRVSPRRARLAVDGVDKGPVSRFAGLGPRRLRLEPGTHRLSFSAPGHVRVDVAVEAGTGAADERRRLEIDLPPKGNR